jgi:1-acyl-sn-glycerol-3-phosphate acyltransferase
LVTVYIWHIVLNCAFASFVFGMPAALLIPRWLDPQRQIPHRIGTFFWGWMVWALNPFWRLEIEGIERLREGGPYLICSNHQSMLDVLVLMALRGDFKWVSGVRFFKIPMLAAYMRITGYIAADLKNPFSARGVLEECGEWLRRGVSVGMFPEGTRSPDGRVGPFKAGAFRVAVEQNVAVLPVAIDGTHRLLPKGSASYTGDSPFGVVKVRVCVPVRLESLATPSTADLSAACREVIGETLAEWRGTDDVYRGNSRRRGRVSGQKRRISISRV